jgi:hypothetical protein
VTAGNVYTGSQGSAGYVKGEQGGAVRVGDDVYAGRDGNVYRNQGGSWQKYDNGSWGNVETPQRSSGQAATTQARDRSTTGAVSSADRWDSGTRDQLDRDRAARSEGSQRTSSYSNYRSSGSRSSASSYRGGGSRGGGSRGGGGRRR